MRAKRFPQTQGTRLFQKMPSAAADFGRDFHDVEFFPVHTAKFLPRTSLKSCFSQIGDDNANMSRKDKETHLQRLARRIHTEQHEQKARMMRGIPRVQCLCLKSLRSFIKALSLTTSSSDIFPRSTHLRTLQVPTETKYKLIRHHPDLMDQQFLAQVLRIENSVTSEDECMICQEICGQLSPETGLMELCIVLPC